MNMPAKEPSLHKRLNDLEYELKELHERILKERHLFIFKDLVNNRKLNLKHAVPKQSFLSENDVEKNSEGYGNNVIEFNKLQTKGTDIRAKTASLTEITSLSSELYKVLEANKKNDVYNQQGLQSGHQVFPRKKSKLVQNRKKVYENINKTLSDVFQCKPGKVPMKGTSSDLMVTPPLLLTKMETPPYFESIGTEAEDRKLDLKLLKERVENVKKKLRDERTKREIAEKAIVGYRRRLAVLEGKIVKNEEKESYQEEHPEMKEKNTVPLVDLVTSLHKQLQGEYALYPRIGKIADGETRKALDSLEKDLNEERRKRLEAEKMVKELKESLEESKKTAIKLEEGKKLAITLADQFRDKATNNDPQETEILKAEKAALEIELKCTKQSLEVSSDIVKKLVERAERAEKELTENMKERNNIMTKSSLNDPEVIKLIEKHKKAYAELQLEKKSKEIELNNRCNGFLKEIEAANVAADKRIKELNDKYNQAVFAVKKKESVIDKIKNEKKCMGSELRNLKIELQETATKKEQQEKLIRTLKAAAKNNDEQMEKTKKENECSKELYASLEIKYNKLQSSITEQDIILEKLRMELEQEKDSVKIKEKMLQDQADTIKCLRVVADNTKKSLDQERILKCQLMDDIAKLENSREKLHDKLTIIEQKLKEAEEEKKKESIIFKQLEHQVRQKHMEWKQQIIQVSHEKEKAIQTARFATEKLIKAVNDYENKLIDHKKVQGLLNSALKEKDYQLHIAKQQVQELNEEVWKSAQMTERIRNELQTKLKKACEVCTDVIDTQIELDV